MDAEKNDRERPGPDEEEVRAAVRACLDGDPEACRRLVRWHEAWVFRLMSRFSRDPQVVEELAREVFVEAWLGLRGYGGRGPFAAWLRTVAVRTGYRHWREKARRRDRVAELPEIAWAALAAPEAADTGAAAEAVRAVLDRLAPADRLALMLYYWEGRSTKEIAADTGWSHTLTRVRLHRARARVRALLGRAADTGEHGAAGP